MTKLLIQIAGDPTVDWLNPVEGTEPGIGPYFYAPNQPLPKVQISSQAGGAALLTSFLSTLLPADAVEVHGQTLDPAFLTNPCQDGVTRAWTTWKLQGDKAHSAYRILDWGRCETGTWNHAAEAGDIQPDLLVIDDSGLGFRDQRNGWPKTLLQKSVSPTPEIIIKLAQYQSADKTLPVLEAISENGLRVRTTVVTSLSDLRACPVRVGVSLSWEGLFEEIISAVRSRACPFMDQAKPGTLRVKQVIVTIGASGAVIVGENQNTLIFSRTGQEGDFERGFAGQMMGYNTAFLGALVDEWIAKREAADWINAARNGTALARELLRGGYVVIHNRLQFPAEELRNALHGADASVRQAKRGDVWDLGIYTDHCGEKTEFPHGWTILERVLCPDDKPGSVSGSDLVQRVRECAEEIVRKGPDKASPMRNVPIETVGFWQSADRHEIEGVRSVNNAMRDYLSNKRSDKPLSIAVFGPPGAGKSFAIKQIASGLGIKEDAQLTFNLSQFESPDELAGAFHQIRDLHLKSKMPLVFWDEFDTPCQQRALGWLRYFLAPIQDGLCVDRGVVHPTGGGIYVFAGGTCKSFNEFRAGNTADDKAAKKPDFISRMRAYIDIKGPNGDPNTIEDKLFMVRRAFLLHSFLTRMLQQVKHGSEFQVDSGLLKALLRTVSYRHGARSMETIVAMSNLKGKKAYELSSLPPAPLLGMHVNTEDFMALTQADHREMLRIGVTGHIGLDPTRLNALNDGIARAVKLIEERYDHRTLTVFSPLAKGADRLVAREILKRPDARLIAVLPVPPEDYMNDFGGTNLHYKDYPGAELRQEFRYLLQHKAIETIVLPPCSTRDEAYAEMGYYIAKHCDIMIAVWDGRSSQGLGGTGDIVQHALEIGKPIVHVWAGNYKDKEDKRTDVGDKHGKVRYCWKLSTHNIDTVDWHGDGIEMKS